MFLIPTITTLFAFIYLRPQEVFEPLRALTFSGVMVAVALSYLLDLRLGFVRPQASPIVSFVLALFGFCVLSVVIKAPAAFNERMTILLASLLSFVFVSQGLHSLRAIGAAAAGLLALTLLLTGIGVFMGTSGKVCYLRDPVGAVTAAVAVEGSPCSMPSDCGELGPSGAEYWCEHPGMLGTRSIGGRVRYRGVLEDPNELAMAVSMAVPLAFAFNGLRRSKLRFALLLATLAASFTCVIMTQSRAGQIAMIAMLGVYFITWFGKRGLVAGLIASLPLLLLGGRSGADAESSSIERLECWSAGFDMWRENPFLGVGNGQFLEHHYLTAHNSVMLTLAEMGPLGLLLWSGALFAAFKIVVRGTIDFSKRPEAAGAYTWALALLASLTAMAVSAFFLSVAYHPVVWIFMGLVAAYYAAVRKHDPSWQVPFGWGDVMLVAGFDVALVTGMFVYLHVKGTY